MKKSVAIDLSVFSGAHLKKRNQLLELLRGEADQRLADSQYGLEYDLGNKGRLVVKNGDYLNNPHPFVTELEASETNLGRAVRVRVNLPLAVCLANSFLMNSKFDTKQGAFNDLKCCLVFEDIQENAQPFTFHPIVAAKSIEMVNNFLEYNRPSQAELAALITTGRDNTFHPWRLRLLRLIMSNCNEITNTSHKKDTEFLKLLAQNMLDNWQQIIAWGDQTFTSQMIDFLGEQLFSSRTSLKPDTNNLAHPRALLAICASFYGFTLDINKLNREDLIMICAVLTVKQIPSVEKQQFTRIIATYYGEDQAEREVLKKELESRANGKCILSNYLLAKATKNLEYFNKLVTLCKTLNSPTLLMAICESFKSDEALKDQRFLKAYIETFSCVNEYSEVIRLANALSDPKVKAEIYFSVIKQHRGWHGFTKGDLKEACKFAYQQGIVEAGIYLLELLLNINLEEEINYDQFNQAVLSFYGGKDGGVLFYRTYKGLSQVEMVEAIEYFCTIMKNKALPLKKGLTILANLRVLDTPKCVDFFFELLFEANNPKEASVIMDVLKNEPEFELSQLSVNKNFFVCLLTMLQDKYNPRSINLHMREAARLLPNALNSWLLYYTQAIRHKDGSMGADPIKRCIYLAVAAIYMRKINLNKFGLFVQVDIVNSLQQYCNAADPTLKSIAEYLLCTVKPTAEKLLSPLMGKPSDVLEEAVAAEQKLKLLPKDILDKFNPLSVQIAIEAYVSPEPPKASERSEPQQRKKFETPKASQSRDALFKTLNNLSGQDTEFARQAGININQFNALHQPGSRKSFP